jgi:hypothetical protein
MDSNDYALSNMGENGEYSLKKGLNLLNRCDNYALNEPGET